MTWHPEGSILHIEGLREMEIRDKYPRESYRKEIVRVAFSHGCTSVGDYAFYNCVEQEMLVPNPNVKWEDSFYDAKWIAIGRNHW